MARHTLSPLSLDQLQPGDEWESPARTITEADIVHFAGLSGDFNPIHMDHESARQGPFKQPVAHGLLGLAISSGLASNFPRVSTLALVAIQDWQFHEAIAPGDTVRTITRVESIESKARGRRGVVTWHRRLVNQRNATVQEGRILTLVKGPEPRPD